ncbi:MAG: YIP1 family protein [Candidatus ainarchaeum sp.]|nr:YIP1 family protein [Candidatus ainarchaeum sp.]MDD5095893.1 YIP1 family protein [Candidatus ainarchaeum sp.]
MGMIENLTGALFPAKLAAMVKKEKGSVGEGLKYLVLAGVISILLSMVSLTVSGTGTLMQAADFIGQVVLLVLGLVVALVAIWLTAWLVSALLKGKAEFGQLFFALSVPASAIQIVSAVVMFILGFIPMLGLAVAGIIGLLLWLYGFYLAYVVFRAVYGFEMMNAVISLVVYLVLTAIIGAIVLGIGLGIVAGILGLGAIGGAAAAGAFTLPSVA